MNQQPKSSKDVVRVEGVVQEAFPGTSFSVKIDGDKTVLAHLAGKMRMHYIKILPGDRVLLEMPSLDGDRGRIVRRF